MSQYTGRIHLYSCISGEDSRPRPLFENFRPEELESLNSLAAESIKGAVSNLIKNDPAYLRALLAFSKEWKKLRPIEQRKLIGKPLQLPLSVELCFLCEGTNHDNMVHYEFPCSNYPFWENLVILYIFSLIIFYLISVSSLLFLEFEQAAVRYIKIIFIFTTGTAEGQKQAQVYTLR